MHGSLAILLESSFRVSAVALSLGIVTYGSFLFAYFLEQIKSLKKQLLKTVHAWGCMLIFYISYSC